MERKTGVSRGLERAFRRVLQSFSRRATGVVDLRKRLERVTGIEPAWPAWKAMAPHVSLRWSEAILPYAVPLVCLSSP
jgi:hypothetical protein